ncbi:Nif3-like dinuclear metal center hexameric protein [Fructobacillus fructosus]|uniref:Nif3-like dinuclear metal center hexameric protein n=1 Tax=Fructobacillus fructosus TaxID=1631 RepID=UPI001658B23D|nr:Nif3-like dinuclear metal center hexameric protein [Fructobacillus fructosus]MBC9118842.1 Nif3-like dinuclear metal center hexameric protein [Fructobacillus fructosus]MBD9365506.1 Nif3-like dinuclear metal center hexameric protein [Leuconostoc mesenteroides]
MILASDLIQKIESFAPKELAEEGDPTGLQIGDPKQAIHRVMTTLDVRPETVQEAIEQQVDFIWAHHEPMFFPAKNLDLSNPQNKMYAELIKQNIVVYSSHTNLDAAAGGLNDWLCTAFEIEDATPLVVDERNKNAGLGRIGTLKKPLSMADYARQVKSKCGVAAVRLIANNPNRMIQRVAVLGGDGGKFWPQAQAAGADLYVTADLYYHVGHDVLAEDFAVLDPDHHMEAIAKEPMAEKVREWFPQGLSVVTSKVNTDPYRYL